MPIEISTRKVKIADTSAPFFTYDAPYLPVHQHGYGFMDSTTPAPGLSTCKVTACLAIVLHSPKIGRTALAHTPNLSDIDTLAPIVDWITGGEGTDLDMVSWRQGAGATPSKVEVVVMRGNFYDTPALAIGSGHTEWMRQFRRWFTVLAEPRAIHFDILDEPRVLRSGAVAVDKTTAHIHYLEPETRWSRDPRAGFLVQNPPLSQVYTRSQSLQHVFVGTLLAIKQGRAPLLLQYDVSHYCLPIPLPDEARQILRSKRLGEPLASQSAIIRRLLPMGDRTNARSLEANLMSGAGFAGDMSPPCELCTNIGFKRCAACKGAWYCGEEHQKRDWNAHKAWCKAHRMPK